MKKLRLMVITDDPFSGSGFGEEMRNITFRLVQTGTCEVIWFSLQHTDYQMEVFDYQFDDLPHKGAKISVVGGRPEDIYQYGAGILPKHWVEHSPDIVMFMGDPRNLASYVLPEKKSIKDKLGFPLYMYVTLDGLPINPTWLQILKRVNVLIAMTEWAQMEYVKVGLQPAFIHHGVNWNQWIVSKQEKERLRKKYRIPEGCVVYGNWEVNQHRKRTDALLRCWKAFEPETKNVKLLLYTDWRMENRLGWNLYNLLDEYSLKHPKFKDSTIIDPITLQGSPKYWEVPEPPWKVREIAALIDVYVSTTSGEGFGKCPLEALSMRIPVIITDYSACTEVCAKGSKLIPITDTFRWDDKRRGVRGGLVNETKFVEAMKALYYNRQEIIELGKQARQWAREFDYDTKIIPAWKRLLLSINPDEIMARKLLQL